MRKFYYGQRAFYEKENIITNKILNVDRSTYTSLDSIVRIVRRSTVRSDLNLNIKNKRRIFL